MARVEARWLDLGRVSPARLHASYQGLAEAAPPDAPPTVVWAVCDRPHLSIGASQWPEAELDRAACRARGIELVQRPLGGGTVLVDGRQHCFFLILPERHRPGRPPALFDSALSAAVAVFLAFGLPAQRRGQTDLWLGGRKVLGSGAATLGRSMVFGSSFLLGFDAGLFAGLVRAPSNGFRAWLAEALREGMTSWSEHAEPPAAEALQQALRDALTRQQDWAWRPAETSAAERAAIAEAEAELATGWESGGRRLVPDGIKVNHGRYLVEIRDAAGWLRLDIVERRIARLAGDGAHGAAPQACRGCEPERDRLLRALGESLSAARAGYWAERIDAAAAGVRRVWDV